ncbi:MAG: DUF1249 domain-containing protein [Thioalkalivibrionaceae bacterium]
MSQDASLDAALRELVDAAAFSDRLTPYPDESALPSALALSSLFELFESNYRGLRRLLPDLRERSAGSSFAGRATSAPTLYLLIEDQSPYTTTLRMTHRFGAHGTRQPDLAVRIFHDARQAEVLDRFCRQAEGHVVASDLPDQRSLYCRLQHSRFLNRWLELLHTRRYAFDVGASALKSSEVRR